MKVLVLDSGNSSSYHAMRSLARAGCQVHLVAGPYCHWQHSKYCSQASQWPTNEDGREDETLVIPFLLHLLQQEKYGLLLSCGDSLTEAIVVNHAAISALVECAIPGPRLNSIIFNKAAASRFVEQLGVPIPRTYSIEQVMDAAPGSRAYLFPMVVKGQKGSGASNVRFARNQEELEASFQLVKGLEPDIPEDPAIQEFVGGPGFLVHFLFWHGEPYAICCHRKDREYPVGGGVTSAGTTVDIPELKAATLRIGRALEWHGLAKMDFLFDPVSGQYKFVEIDPRVSASIDITRVAGVDQVAMLANLVQGKSVVPDLSFQAGVRYRWLFPRDLLVGAVDHSVLLSLAYEVFLPNMHFDLGPRDWWPFYYQIGRFIQERKFLDKNLREAVKANREVRAAYQARPDAANSQDIGEAP